MGYGGRGNRRDFGGRGGGGGDGYGYDYNERRYLCVCVWCDGNLSVLCNCVQEF